MSGNHRRKAAKIHTPIKLFTMRRSDMRAERWDAFISHAHEDKTAFVADLARELGRRGLRIWYDDDVLEHRSGRSSR